VITHIVYAFVFIFQFFAIFIYFENALASRKNTMLRNVLFVVAWAVQLAISFLQVPILNMAAFAVVTFLIAYLCYGAKPKSCIFHVCMLTLYMLGTEIFIVYFSSLILKIHVDPYANDVVSLVFEAVLSKLLFFIATYFASKIRKKREGDLENIPILLSLSIVPFSSIIFLYILVYWAMSNSMDQTLTIWFIIGTVLLLLTNIIVFLVYELTRRTHIQFTQLQLEKQREKISAEYYELLLKKHEDHKILIHDIKRHLQAIQEMAAGTGQHEIQQYTSALCGEFGLSDVITYSGNKYVDVIINRYAHDCKTKGFSLETDVRGVSMDFMDDMDITALLDNLLENAVEAVAQAREKQIIMSFFEQNDNYVVIKTQNSCDQPPRLKNGKILSSKKDGQAHGIGLKSILRIAAKYHGDVDWRYYEETATFEMVIVMNRAYGKAAPQSEKISV
jgi:hypothetical protein